MMRFEHPEFLWLLWILPVLGGVFVFFHLQKQKQLKAVGNWKLVKMLVPDIPKYKPYIKTILWLLSITCFIIALANPQVGSKLEKVNRKGVDIIVAFDLSKSMLADDLKPNRLERAKAFVNDLVEQMHGDRLGFVVFAGNAYLQMPLTVDYGAFGMYLKNVNPDLIPTQGTNIGEAIDESEKAFKAGEKKSKVLIIVSDGETFDEDAKKTAEAAAKEGTVIYTIGVGTPDGGPIPVMNSNGEQVDYKRDNEGNIVLTKLNEPTLQQLAEAGNGSYFRADGGREAARELYKDISGLEQKSSQEKLFTDYNDQFQYFLFTGLLLLIIEYFISGKRNDTISKWKIFEVKNK